MGAIGHRRGLGESIMIEWKEQPDTEPRVLHLNFNGSPDTPWRDGGSVTIIYVVAVRGNPPQWAFATREAAERFVFARELETGLLRFWGIYPIDVNMNP